MPHVLRRNRARRPRRQHAAVALLFIVGALAPRTGTADVVFDPWNFAQNVVSAIQSITAVAQQVQQLANETTQIANQVQQLQDMANQAARITAPTWGEVQVSIAALANAVQIGQAIAYNLPDIQARFQAQFPGYVPPTDWNTQLQQSSQSTLDTLNATLYSAGLNAGDFDSVQGALTALRDASDGATGRNELLQVGNSLASLQIQEMTKMRQLLALEISAQNVWKANSTNTNAASEAAVQRFIGTPGAVANPFASGAGVNP